MRLSKYNVTKIHGFSGPFFLQKLPERTFQWKRIKLRETLLNDNLFLSIFCVEFLLPASDQSDCYREWLICFTLFLDSWKGMSTTYLCFSVNLITIIFFIIRSRFQQHCCSFLYFSSSSLLYMCRWRQRFRGLTAMETIAWIIENSATWFTWGGTRRWWIWKF